MQKPMTPTLPVHSGFSISHLTHAAESLSYESMVFVILSSLPRSAPGVSLGFRA